MLFPEAMDYLGANLESHMGRHHYNPHPFDMSNYFSGHVCVVGGKNFDLDEKEQKDQEQEKAELRDYRLDWSFLKQRPSQNNPERS